MPKKQLNQNVLIELIDLSAGTQQRPLSPDTLERYSELRKDGCEFPPIECISDGKEFYVWDGFHRVAVEKQLGKTHIRANVEIGNLRRAVWLSFSANSKHGLPRQSGILGQIIDQILADSEWAKKSMADIARHVDCSRQYVRKRYQEKGISELEETETVDSDKKKQGKADKKPETEPKAPPRDGAGQIIPEPLVDRYLSRAILYDVIQTLDKCKNQILHSIEDGNLGFALLNQSGFKADCNNLRARLKSGMPFALCSYCGGKGCDACHQSGFLNHDSWKAAPKEE